MSPAEISAQEVFDKVSGHLLTQNARAANGPRCRYRSSTGAKCAVGCLIDDEVYSPTCEDKSVFVLVAGGILGPEYGGHIGLLCDLQRVHDSTAVCDWRLELERVAKHHGLQFSANEGEP